VTGQQRGGARGARLFECVAISVVLAAASASPLRASQPERTEKFDRVSLPYACRIDHGRLRLEPSPDQVYPVSGSREEQPFTACRERQSCQTLTLHKFAITCSGQRVPWADIVMTLADKGHLDKPGNERGQSRLTVTDGRLGFLVKSRTVAKVEPPQPPVGGLTGWCSEQFGGPVQPFLRQACNEARRLVANLGGPQPRITEQLAPQFIALPKGFAPVRTVGARLLPPLPSSPTAPLASSPLGAAPLAAAPSAPSALEGTGTDAAVVVTPALTAQEPNDRIAALAAAFPPRPAPAGSTWITSVHLASATVAASTQAATERQRSDTSSTFMMVFAAVLAAIAAAVALRYRQSRAVPVAPPSAARSAAQLRLSAPAGHSPSAMAPATGPSPWLSLRKSLASGLRRQLNTLQAYRGQRSLASHERPPQTAEELAARAALPPEGRLIMTTRDQLVDRIDALRQTIDPLGRSASALHMALARDLMAGERRLDKITMAGLADEPAAENTRKRAHARLQRVSADLDRLQEIIAGAVASFARETGPRQLPRDLPEAYATLGVNANVSESTLKKLVDALRVSWHPDLATSPEDWQLRDERIKQINVAWDLIAGRRAAD
jgi:hypothetical protein